MKLALRALVFGLVFTGISATYSSSHAQAKTTKMAMNSASPVPTCPPNDPNGCGIGAFTW